MDQVGDTLLDYIGQIVSKADPMRLNQHQPV